MDRLGRWCRMGTRLRVEFATLEQLSNRQASNGLLVAVLAHSRQSDLGPDGPCHTIRRTSSREPSCLHLHRWDCQSHLQRRSSSWLGQLVRSLKSLKMRYFY